MLVAYLLVWFAVFELVDWLTAFLGLPLWTPGMAFVLLGIGLPIVLATAAAQGGLPGLRIVDEVDPNELEGRTPDEVHVIPEAHPLHGTTLLTWRNAVLGGVMAGALLVTSVVAYLTMWALGIGPVGSLAAQGILSAGDTVAVLPFVDRTGVGDAGARAGRRLATELARSPFVEVLGPEALGAGPGASEGPAMVSGRGVSLVVAGEVLDEGGQDLRVRARILLPDGTVLGALWAEATNLSELDAEIDRMSLRLRERFGESLRSVHRGEEGRTKQ